MSEKPKLDLGVLEEDDEFEEFPVEGEYNAPGLISMRLRHQKLSILSSFS